MDLKLNIPTFALLRHGTVIVRLKMEVTESSGLEMEVAESCCGSEVRPAKGYRRVVHRLSGCERCNRTRYSKRHICGCDSGKVNTTAPRPYRASSARSRYVNVCAAVCLLLVVGGLAPRAAAAPHRTKELAPRAAAPHRTMDRAKRSDAGENQLWANPCDLDESIMKSQISYKPEFARTVAVQALSALHSAEKYKAEVAKAHTYESFEKLFQTWSGYEFIRKLESNPWYHRDVLPLDKMYGTPADEQYLDELMEHINEVLPSMYKVLKVLVASIFHISEKWSVNSGIPDNTLKNSLLSTAHDVRSVLCGFYDVMRARNLEMMPLLDSELPNFEPAEIDQDMFLIYRDTLNYLEYINQVFDKMARTDLDKNA